MANSEPIANRSTRVLRPRKPEISNSIPKQLKRKLLKSSKVTVALRSNRMTLSKKHKKPDPQISESVSYEYKLVDGVFVDIQHSDHCYNHAINAYLQCPAISGSMSEHLLNESYNDYFSLQNTLDEMNGRTIQPVPNTKFLRDENNGGSAIEPFQVAGILRQLFPSLQPTILSFQSTSNPDKRKNTPAPIDAVSPNATANSDPISWFCQNDTIPFIVTDVIVYSGSSRGGHFNEIHLNDAHTNWCCIESLGGASVTIISLEYIRSLLSHNDTRAIILLPTRPSLEVIKNKIFDFCDKINLPIPDALSSFYPAQLDDSFNHVVVPTNPQLSQAREGAPVPLHNLNEIDHDGSGAPRVPDSTTALLNSIFNDIVKNDNTCSPLTCATVTPHNTMVNTVTRHCDTQPRTMTVTRTTHNTRVAEKSAAVSRARVRRLTLKASARALVSGAGPPSPFVNLGAVSHKTSPKDLRIRFIQGVQAALNAAAPGPVAPSGGVTVSSATSASRKSLRIPAHSGWNYFTPLMKPIDKHGNEVLGLDDSDDDDSDYSPPIYQPRGTAAAVGGPTRRGAQSLTRPKQKPLRVPVPASVIPARGRGRGQGIYRGGRGGHRDDRARANIHVNNNTNANTSTTVTNNTNINHHFIPIITSRRNITQFPNPIPNYQPRFDKSAFSEGNTKRLFEGRSVRRTLDRYGYDGRTIRALCRPHLSKLINSMESGDVDAQYEAIKAFFAIPVATFSEHHRPGHSSPFTHDQSDDTTVTTPPIAPSTPAVVPAHGQPDPNQQFRGRRFPPDDAVVTEPPDVEMVLEDEPSVYDDDESDFDVSEFMVPTPPINVRYDSIKRNIDAVNALIEENHISHAVKRAQYSAPVDMSNPVILDTLKALHPPASKVIFPSPPSSAPRVGLISKKQLKSALYSLDTGSAPSVSGWSVSFLFALLCDEECNLGLRHMLTLIINNELCDDARHFFTDCLLILIEKIKGGFRPIAITEVLLRVAALISKGLLPSASVLFSSGIQCAFSPGSAQTIIHRQQSALEADKENMLLSFDIEAAFPSSDRPSMANNLYSDTNFAAIWNMFCFTYKSDSNLFLMDGRNIVAVNGALQGDVLSSLAFSKNMDSIYSDTVAGESVSAAADIDDFSLVAKLPTLSRCLAKFTSLCKANGYKINFTKTYLLVPASLASDPGVIDFVKVHNIELKVGFAELLGSCVGFDQEAMCRFVREKIEKADRSLFSLLRHSAFRAQPVPKILRLCASGMLAHITSTIPLAPILPAVKEFEEKLLSVYCNKMSIERHELNDAEQQVRLRYPGCHGGLGFRSQSDMADVDFLCSYIRAFPFINPNHRLASSPTASLTHAKDILSKLHSTYPGLSQYVLPTFNDEASRFIPNPNAKKSVKRNLHNAIVVGIEQSRYEALIADPLVPLTLKATLTQFAQSIPRRMFDIVGSDALTKLDDNYVGQFYRFYHTLFASAAAPPPFCACGAEFTPHHPHCCPQLKREEMTKDRHDPIEDSVAACCSESGVRVLCQRRINDKARLLPDLNLTFFDSNKNSACLADVVVTHTSAPSYIAQDPIAVLRSKEKAKHTKYNNDCFIRPRGAPVRKLYGTIYGLSISSYGVFGPEFLALVQRTSHHSRADGRMHFDMYPSQHSYRMIDRILIALHKGNALVQLAGWQRASSLLAQTCAVIEPAEL